MGKMLAEFPDLPWEMRMELAHQMWDEARHIEIVAKAVEEELGGELGYGPWTLVWWWMQNEPDPLRRITVTNSWAEANLMHTLAQWRTEAEKRGYTRIAELADYLQADERTHVRLATDWIQTLTEDEPSSATSWPPGAARRSPASRTSMPRATRRCPTPARRASPFSSRTVTSRPAR